MENLRVYQIALMLVKEVYTLIHSNDKLKRDFSLCDQIKRAAVSVPCNISEGYCRTKKQSKHYLLIAIGSANEVRTLLEIISLLYSINTEKLQDQYNQLGKQINSLSKHITSNL